jgi:hypothetical protein
MVRDRTGGSSEEAASSWSLRKGLCLRRWEEDLCHPIRTILLSFPQQRPGWEQRRFDKAEKGVWDFSISLSGSSIFLKVSVCFSSALLEVHRRKRVWILPEDLRSLLSGKLLIPCFVWVLSLWSTAGKKISCLQCGKYVQSYRVCYSTGFNLMWCSPALTSPFLTASRWARLLSTYMLHDDTTRWCKIAFLTSQEIWEAYWFAAVILANCKDPSPLRWLKKEKKIEGLHPMQGSMRTARIVAHCNDGFLLTSIIWHEETQGSLPTPRITWDKEMRGSLSTASIPSLFEDHLTMRDDRIVFHNLQGRKALDR